MWLQNYIIGFLNNLKIHVGLKLFYLVAFEFVMFYFCINDRYFYIKLFKVGKFLEIDGTKMIKIIIINQ